MLFGINKQVEKKLAYDPNVDGPYGSGCEEPELEEILSDPMIHQIARADNVAPRELAETIKEMRRRFRGKC